MGDEERIAAEETEPTLSEVIAELRAVPVDWGADPVGELLKMRHGDEDRLAALEQALRRARVWIAATGKMEGAPELLAEIDTLLEREK